MFAHLFVRPHLHLSPPPLDPRLLIALLYNLCPPCFLWLPTTLARLPSNRSPTTSPSPKKEHGRIGPADVLKVLDCAIVEDMIANEDNLVFKSGAGVATTGRKQSTGSRVGTSASTAGQGRGLTIQLSSGSIRLPPPSASTSASAGVLGTPTGDGVPFTVKLGVGKGVGGGAGRAGQSVNGTEVDEDKGAGDEDGDEDEE